MHAKKNEPKKLRKPNDRHAHMKYAQKYASLKRRTLKQRHVRKERRGEGEGRTTHGGGRDEGGRGRVR